ncbi:MAG: right-handed parallel beta-helix repeat-containing protein, partial [Candidatus Woesearchaeota archaeon]
MYTRVGVWTSILFFLVLAPLVTSATYYVDSNTGIDTNNGLSTSTPIKTLSKLSTMRLNPGDNVLFNNCGTWRESFMYSSNSGTASSPITFSSYGSCNTKPKFYGSVNANAESYWTNRGNNLWESQANFTSEIYQIFYNTNGVTELGQRRTTLDTLQGNWDFYWDSTSKKVIVYQTSNPGSVGNGIELPKYSTPYNNALIYFDTAEYIIFKNIEISYARYNGLEDYRGNHNEFRNLDFKYIYAKAAWLEGNNVILSDSSFYKSGIRGSVAPEGQGSQGENVWITQIQNPIITNNIIERCGGVCINFFHTTGGSATNNKVFNCEQDPADWSAAIYYDGCNNSIISYNEISDCQIGLQAGTEVNGWNSKNLTFQHNVVIDSAISSIIITSELGKITNYDININHNTFYNTKYVVGSGFGNEVFIKYFDKLIFKDNIVYNTYTNTNVGNLLYIYMGGTYGTGLDSNYNSWNSKVGRNKWYLNSAQLYSNLSAWQSGQNQDKNSVITVPTFVSASNDDYRLLGNNTLCTASSTGSYVGALPCAGGTPAPYCGDGSCNGVENCSTCASDCGICPPPANTAPTQGTPLLRASDNPYNTTDATLNCYNQSTTDADGDSVTNTYRWYRNNTLMSGLTSSSVSSSNTAPGNVWKCEVRPYDGKTYGVARNSTSLTINALPDITSVKFNSTTPNNYSTDDLTCYASASGALNGITVYYIVYNGSRVYSTGSKSVARNTLTSITTVDSSLLIPNQAWKCSVRASYNGVVNESSWNNASVTIRAMPIPNIAPTHANPILRASDNPLNGTDATLTCYNQSTHDADGDSVTNTYKWYRNNVLVGSQTTSTLSSSITSIGETWKCEVRPYDGKVYGIAKNSSTIIIRSACNNGQCELDESCSSCSADCGVCLSNITSCILTGRSWNEDSDLNNAYNLSSCFYDSSGHTLIYSVAGNNSIRVYINKGMVNLSSPANWSGFENITFTAIDSTNSSRYKSSNSVILTVNPMPDC